MTRLIRLEANEPFQFKIWREKPNDGKGFAWLSIYCSAGGGQFTVSPGEEFQFVLLKERSIYSVLLTRTDESGTKMIDLTAGDSGLEFELTFEPIRT